MLTHFVVSNGRYFDGVPDTRFEVHKSVEALKAKEKEPIELADCLKAFTKEEDMGKDDTWCVVFFLSYAIVAIGLSVFMNIL